VDKSWMNQILQRMRINDNLWYRHERAEKINRMYEKVWNIMKWTLVWVVLMCAAFGGCQFLNRQAGLEDDHELEEQIENILEHHTGIDLDLTPDSPED